MKKTFTQQLKVSVYLGTTADLRRLTNKPTDPKNFQHYPNILKVAN